MYRVWLYKMWLRVKAIDSHSHPIGDQILKNFCERFWEKNFFENMKSDINLSIRISITFLFYLYYKNSSQNFTDKSLTKHKNVWYEGKHFHNFFIPDIIIIQMSVAIFLYILCHFIKYWPIHVNCSRYYIQYSIIN